MKKMILSLLVFTVSISWVFCQKLVIAVSDFKVESRNPSYEFIGKGISRLVASELRKSGEVILVEREEMNRLLAEQELSLTDLMDEAKQVQIGKMLSAKYIVVGEIIDMGNSGLLVSVRMAKVETGEIVWQDEKQEKLAVYDYMGAYFAKSALDLLGVNAVQTTIAKIEKKEEKKPESIIKTSEGIDAYDRKDTEDAKKVLEEARAIDPANEVAEEYLAKLVTNTVKFKVALEPYYADQNPAYLGIIRTDRIYLSNSEPLLVQFTADPNNLPMVPLPNGNELMEWDFRLKLGYSFPVAENLGFDIAGIWFGMWNEIQKPSPLTFYQSIQAGLGGMVNTGYKINDSFSIGFGLSVYTESISGIIPFAKTTDLHPAFALCGGFLVRNTDESLVYDAQIGYCTGKISLLNPDTGARDKEIGMPLFIENTITFALNQRNTFFIVKQLNDISIDRIYYYGRIIPAFEHYFLDWFSLRLGVEGSYALLNNSSNFGYGVMGGMTFRIISCGMDIDINVTYRMRPSRVVEGVSYPDLIGLISFSWNDLFISR